jgi:trans-aconitate 2-methyltransferase
MAWDPEQYLRFKRERRQPFYDLIDLIEGAEVDRAIDLGCGTGEMTRVVHETLGVDSSPDMLAKSEPYAGDGVSFRQVDIADVDGTYDLVFSNAALHWLTDHRALFAKLAARVAPRGQIAIQVPANHDHIGHMAADEVAAEPQFDSHLDGYRFGVRVLDPRDYAEMLRRLGFERLDVRLQIYGHELPTRDDVVEWLKGSLLTAFERRLDPEVFASFVDRYRELLHERLPDDRPFFYTYKRILMWAAKPA